MRFRTFRSKIHRALEENEYGIIIIDHGVAEIDDAKKHLAGLK